ncbi:MAG: DUF4350 domain-containing protein [Nitrososphaerota archaeon]|nr:DUF4350 domain-containing protein [Nitrososphaerota archaeon]
MRVRTAVLAGVVAALLFVSIAVYFAASASILGNPDDFGVSNTSWNGLSTFVSTEHAVVLKNISSLPPDGTGYVLLEDGPSSPYSSAESARISSFVSTGGTLIVADGQYAIANTLLSGMGLSSRFTGGLLTDPLFNFRNSFLVVAPTVSPSLTNVSSIAFNYATTLSVSDPGAQILAYSSDFSYLYPTQPGASISNAPHGPFPVAALVPDGKGKVYLIADDSVFINSMITRDGNGNLLKDISGGSMFVDTSHFVVSPATTVRNFEAAAYGVVSLWEFKYSIVIVGLAGILAYRPKPEPSAEENELKALLGEHPEWSEERLRKLKEETDAR